jgi:hypothetical protein
MTKINIMSVHLGKLLAFVGKVSTEIRMNSSYSRSVDPEIERENVMWLSDAFHEFGLLGDAIEGRCYALVAMFSKAQIKTWNENRNHLSSFPSFRIEDGIQILKDIQDEALKHWDENEIVNISIGLISADYKEPAYLAELVKDISKNGIKEPILVRVNEFSLEIIGGNNRWLAAKHLKLECIPVRFMK